MGEAAVLSTGGPMMALELSRQARINTWRKYVEELMYERSLIPSPEAIRQKQLQEAQNRSLHTPPAEDVYSGEALNALLPRLKELSAKGVVGPDIPLDQNVLRRINVKAGRVGASLGFLKEGRNMQWPTLLLPYKESINGLLTRAVESVTNGTPDVVVLDRLVAEVDRLGEVIDRMQPTTDAEFEQYFAAKRFYQGLRQSVSELRRPGATAIVNGQYAARGQNVAELVQTMSRSGLEFARAQPGEEAAYAAVHDALASYVTVASARERTGNNNYATAPAPLPQQHPAGGAPATAVARAKP